jgi:magnesium-protoporphyrin O-methyltransferase
MSYMQYVERRGRLQTYFDRTAADAWARLTSTEPVSKIRETVRAGRDSMRGTILEFLPRNLSGSRLLDAGCGTGALSVAAAKRGAEVIAIDLSASLVALAKERLPSQLEAGRIEFKLGDMSDAALGEFDHVVAMDSLIHYPAREMVEAISALAARTDASLLVTFAPRTPALSAMHAVGKLFPRGDRAPAIEPVGEAALNRRLAAALASEGWKRLRTRRVESGFYKSQALEMVRR